MGNDSEKIARIDRRKFVKGAIATTGALAAASYTRPELRALGASRALAVSPGGETPTETPTEPPEDPPTSHSCSLSVRVDAEAEKGKIFGEVCIKNESDDDGSCEISKVSVLVEPKKEHGGFGGGCGNPWYTLISRSSTGGTNPLTAGQIIPGPTGNKVCFTLAIYDSQIKNLVHGDDYRVHVVIEFGPHHVHGTRTTQACDTVDV